MTCAGDTFAGRVAGSLLHAAGLPELVAGSPAAYESVALRLAREPALLQALRRKLLGNRLNSPLFDIARYTRHYETSLVQMWETWANGHDPAAFAVPPLPNMDNMVWRLLHANGVDPYWGEIEHYHNFSRKRLYALLQNHAFRPVEYRISERYRLCMEVIAIKNR